VNRLRRNYRLKFTDLEGLEFTPRHRFWTEWGAAKFGREFVRLSWREGALWDYEVFSD